MDPHARRPAEPAQALAQISSCALPLRKPSRESGLSMGRQQPDHRRLVDRDPMTFRDRFGAGQANHGSSVADRTSVSAALKGARVYPCISNSSWLRAPATNDPGGLRSPNSPAAPQSAPGFLLPSAAKLSKAARSPRSTIASSRDRFGVGLLESVLQRRHLRPVPRYSSGRFGIGRGAGATPACLQGPLAAFPLLEGGQQSRRPAVVRDYGDDAGKSPARICGA